MTATTYLTLNLSQHPSTANVLPVFSMSSECGLHESESTERKEIQDGSERVWRRLAGVHTIMHV